MLKYLIFGNGYIGNKFKTYFGDDAIISTQRIKSSNDVGTEILVHDPEVVINCMGRTGKPNVDWCEDHKMETAKGNIAIPLMVAEACLEFKKYMVHISSGCIYEGDNGGKGWTEEDEPNFGGSYYSRTKALSEKILKEFPILQIRIRIPLDDIPSDRNVINKIIKYAKIVEIENSITYLPDLMRVTDKLIDSRAVGIYNVVNKGAVKYSFVLDKYKEIVNPEHTYELFTPAELDAATTAKRSNCVLSIEKLEKEGIHIRPIEEAVVKALTNYKENQIQYNMERE